MAFAQLIPGLPNDLAFQCLLCLSSKELLRAQDVSSLWKIAITSDRFYVERRLRIPYPSICVIRRIGNSYQILDTDVAHLTTPRLLFSCDLQVGQMLFPPGVVFASVDTSVLAFVPGGQVQKFSLLTRRWIPVSKTMPQRCKILARTIGKHVVVLACKRLDDDDNDDDDAGDGALRHTVCEAFDSHKNQWISLEGLPDVFAGTHFVTCEGILYVRGESDGWITVYSLDLSKRKWKEDVHMGYQMHDVLPEGKVIFKPDVKLMATRHSNTHPVLFQHQRVDSIDDWMDVVQVNPTSAGDYFLFQEGDNIFLVVSDASVSWRSRAIFYYHGLTILHIPGEELLMADLIVGQIS